MRITFVGWTRLVILTERSAFKIALLFRPFAPLSLALRAYLSGEFKERLKKYEGRNKIRVALALMFGAGLRANRQEIRLARLYPEYPLTPVLRSYLWGLVIVMPRGEAIRELPAWLIEAAARPGKPPTDLLNPNQLCAFGKEIRFVDFGHPDAEEALRVMFA